MQNNVWPAPHGPPDFARYYHALRSEVGSWTLQPSTIWTPCWLDAFPPSACLCAAWGGYSDRSRVFPEV